MEQGPLWRVSEIANEFVIPAGSQESGYFLNYLPLKQKTLDPDFRGCVTFQKDFGKSDGAQVFLPPFIKGDRGGFQRLIQDKRIKIPPAPFRKRGEIRNISRL
jgi:hypothetical protein